MKQFERIANREDQERQKYLDTRALQKLAHSELVTWLTLNFKAQTMVSLTFDTNWHKQGRRQIRAGSWADDTHTEWVVRPWVAYGWFLRWVRSVNEIVEGPKYKSRWKHSYFGYVVAKEYQSRGVEHFHVLIDNWFPFQAASRFWWDNCGACNIKPVEDLSGSVKYALKYCLKSGVEPNIWVPNHRWDYKKHFNSSGIVSNFLNQKV